MRNLTQNLEITKKYIKDFVNLNFAEKISNANNLGLIFCINPVRNFFSLISLEQYRILFYQKNDLCFLSILFNEDETVNAISEISNGNYTNAHKSNVKTILQLREYIFKWYEDIMIEDE